MRRIKELEGFENYRIVKFRPSLLNLFGPYYPEKITMRRIIRFFLALPYGYRIYSLISENTTIGYCTVQSGKSPRFEYTGKMDIVIGPYVIMPEYQGHGLAAKLIEIILKNEISDFKYAYAYIKKDNIASIRTCEKIGFQYYGDAIVTAIKADVKVSKNKKAPYSIYRIKESWLSE